MKTRTKHCSICGNPIDAVVHGSHAWLHGHNAQPVNDGRCCSVCHDTVVIPRRIADMQKRGEDK